MIISWAMIKGTFSLLFQLALCTFYVRWVTSSWANQNCHRHTYPFQRYSNPGMERQACCWVAKSQCHRRSNVLTRTSPILFSPSCTHWKPNTRLLLSDDSNNNNNNNGNDSNQPTESLTDTSSTAASPSSSTDNANPHLESTISSSWATSFDDAGKSLIEEEDNQKMSQMGDFDSNPAYQPDRMEQMRAAVQARTASLGMEKSKISQQLIQEATARAASGQRTNWGLDLTKISTSDNNNNDDSVREQIPEGLPAMFYDPEELMTEEEKIEADPDGQLPILQQVMKELQNSKWPTPLAALREVGIMFIVVVLSCLIIIGWDNFLRELYTSWGFIPRMEDVMAGRSLDGLELPEGWTNNMSDQDMVNLENDLSSAVKSTIMDSSSSATPSSPGTLPEL